MEPQTVVVGRGQLDERERELLGEFEHRHPVEPPEHATPAAELAARNVVVVVHQRHEVDALRAGPLDVVASAGGLMTTEPIILGPEASIAEALARVGEGSGPVAAGALPSGGPGPAATTRIERL